MTAIKSRAALKMDVSIIIVNWNTCDVLRNCLVSIYENTKDIEFEVIVIDNMSSDNSVSMIKATFPQVKLIENSENRGFATANNQAITAAKGRYILLLNSDTVILDNAISKTIRFADNHPEAAVAGCRVLNPDRTLQPTCFAFPSVLNLFLWTTCLSRLFPKNRFLGREHMMWWNRDNVKEVDVVTGCFMLIRHAAIEATGLLDERYFIYGEETDWCYRFKQAGWKIMFTPDADIIHLGGASTIQVSLKMTLEYINSMLFFFKKHKSRLSYTLACLLLSICLFSRVPFWLVRAACSKKVRTTSMQRAKNCTVGACRALFGVLAR